MAKKPSEIIALDPKTMNWSGYRAVAMIPLEPTELFARHGLTFHESYDGLDDLRASSFRGPLGHVFALVRHINSPAGGTELFVRADSPGKIEAGLREATKLLGLSISDLPWVIGKTKTKSIRNAAKRADSKGKRSKIATKRSARSKGKAYESKSKIPKIVSKRRKAADLG